MEIEPDEGETDLGATIAAPPRLSLAARIPIVTGLLCGICILVFVGILGTGDFRSWDSLRRWGYLSAIDVWRGGYWALVSSAFVHLALWHVAFNVYWLWILGALVERLLGSIQYLAFVLTAAFVSSAIQLGTSGATGHGASGVVYALFGLLWMIRKTGPEDVVARIRHIGGLFWIWLVGCVVTTQLGVFTVGNGAHVGGVLFGLAVGHLLFAPAHRRLAQAGIGVLTAASLLPLVWCPWRPEWFCYRGYEAHASHDYDAAIDAYKRALSSADYRGWALGNLALAYHAKGAISDYAATLAQLRGIDAARAEGVEAELFGQTRSPGEHSMTVQETTPISEVAVTLHVPGSADFLVADGEDVWATNEGRVERFRLGEPGPIASVAVPEPCGAMAVAFDSLWVANCSDASLYRIDPRVNKVVAILKTGLADPKGELSIAAGAGSIWLLTDYRGVLSRIDPATNTVVATVAVRPSSYAAVFGFDSVWVSNTEAGSLQRVEPGTNRVVATVETGPRPLFLAAGEGGVFTLNQGDGTLTRVDPATNTVAATIDAGVPGTGGDIATGGGRVWVRAKEVLLSAVDPQTNAVVERFGPKLGSGAVRVAGPHVWVTDHDSNAMWVLPVSKLP